MYYSTRADGWFLTATAPDLSAADPWVGDNNAVRLNGQAHGDSPDGVFHDADLYCGHDTGDPADGCSNHPRGDGRDFYWCGNDGTVTVSCGVPPSRRLQERRAVPRAGMSAAAALLEATGIDPAAPVWGAPFREMAALYDGADPPLETFGVSAKFSNGKPATALSLIHI